jgi:hypothetical protein
MTLNVSRVRKIFTFLKKNTEWNSEFQGKEYRRSLFHCDSNRSRLRHFLHLAVHTQQRPKLSELADFWKNVDAYAPVGRSTVRSFTAHLTTVPKGRGQWEQLFHALCDKNGWGEKTSAERHREHTQPRMEL